VSMGEWVSVFTADKSHQQGPNKPAGPPQTVKGDTEVQREGLVLGQ
jgi:hypothetical protein